MRAGSLAGRQVVLILPVIVALAGCTGQRGAHIMSWGEYATRSPRWPHVLRFDHSRGSLLYYGARHTYGSRDVQVEEIERLWTCFRPSIAFNEGGHPPVETSRDAAVEKYGEAGLVRFLAARDDVPVASLDPDRAEEVAHLRRAFPAGDAKLFFVLKATAQFVDRRGAAGVDAELERVLGILNAAPGLGGAPRSLAEVSRAYAERFPGQGEYRETPMRWFDPTRSDTLLNQMARTSSEYRDRAMVALLTRHVVDGQRVFAVVGGTHVVMQERALNAILGQPGYRPTGGCR